MSDLRSRKYRPLVFIITLVPVCWIVKIPPIFFRPNPAQRLEYQEQPVSARVPESPRRRQTEDSRFRHRPFLRVRLLFSEHCLCAVFFSLELNCLTGGNVATCVYAWERTICHNMGRKGRNGCFIYFQPAYGATYLELRTNLRGANDDVAASAVICTMSQNFGKLKLQTPNVNSVPRCSATFVRHLNMLFRWLLGDLRLCKLWTLIICGSGK